MKHSAWGPDITLAFLMSQDPTPIFTPDPDKISKWEGRAVASTRPIRYFRNKWIEDGIEKVLKKERMTLI